MPADRIEILEIGLDENLKKEIEEKSNLSSEIQIKIKTHLDGMKKQPINKRTQQRRQWEGKLDTIFGILEEAYSKDPNELVPKKVLMESIGCEEKDFSPLMQRFKKYLRTTKEDKWVVNKKRRKGGVNYHLVPFA
jgi:hypothetical protein